MSQSSQAIGKIALLSETLLNNLDEKIFFHHLASFIKAELEVDQVKAYHVTGEQAVRLIACADVTEIDEEHFNKGESLASYVSGTNRPYFCNNVKRDPLFSAFKNINNIISECCIPILSQGNVIATINLQGLTDETEFSAETIAKVESILDQISTALNNIKLYLSAKKLNETLLKKIEMKDAELKNKDKSTTHHYKIKEHDFIGNSKEISEVLEVVNKIAPTNSNILILGESGTGKELIARKSHCKSKRSEGPYVVVNCGAIQESLLESEFFGHEKGSFTGAIATKEGLVEKAHMGTLFLDEVAELSPAMQTKLLRFLEQGEAYRVGGTSSYRVSVRILAATNKDLKTEVEEGRFREDLYYRLNTISVKLPSLRERKDDICQLANFFLNENKEVHLQKSLTPGAVNVLMSYNWPGNIRELKNVMERSYILSDGKFIDETHLTDCNEPEEIEEGINEVFHEMTLSDLEKKHICRTLDFLSGNKTKTAKTLGITVKTLYNKLHSYGMIQPRETLN